MPRLAKSEMAELNVCLLSCLHPYRNSGTLEASSPPVRVRSCLAGGSLSPLLAGFEENESNLPCLVAKAASREKRSVQRGGCSCPSCFGRRWSRVKENEDCSLSYLLEQHEANSSPLRPSSLVTGTSSASPLRQCIVIKISLTL